MKYESLNIKNQLCFPLYVCSKEIIRKYKPFLDEIGLTYTQYIAMMVLWEKNTINVKELGKSLFLDSGTLTPMLKSMAKSGLIIRERSTSDERNTIITITEKGIELQEKAKEIPLKMSACLQLSNDELAILYSLLYKIINS